MRSRERLAIREREITDLWRLRLEERESMKKKMSSWICLQVPKKKGLFTLRKKINKKKKLGTLKKHQSDEWKCSSN